MAMQRKRKSNGARKIKDRIAELNDDISAIQDDVKAVAGDVGDVALERTGRAKSLIDGALAGARIMAGRRVASAQHSAQKRISKALHDAEDMVDRLSGEVEDWASENADNARETIRNQPLAACVLSIGAGALIGALLLRR